MIQTPEELLIVVGCIIGGYAIYWLIAYYILGPLWFKAKEGLDWLSQGMDNLSTAIERGNERRKREETEQMINAFIEAQIAIDFTNRVLDEATKERHERLYQDQMHQHWVDNNL